jgi:predicted  nucleic acid-binding Zn-ribbon protein
MKHNNNESRTRNCARFIVACAFLVSLAGLQAEEQTAEESQRDVEKEYRRLQFELVTLRQKLLTEDSEIAELNKQVLDLYKKLEAKIQEKEEVRKLTAKMKDLETQIQQLKNR